MYIIYSDGEPIYSPNLINKGYSVYNGKITTELNRSGTFEFRIPNTNPMYNNLKKLNSIITVERDGEEIWRGRILEDTRDFYNIKRVVCEGEIGYFNDVLVPPYDYSTSGVKFRSHLTYLLSEYGKHCSSNRMIELGIIKMEDPDQLIYPRLDDYSDVLTCLGNDIIDSIGGYIFTRRENDQTYLDYYEDLTEVSDQTIIFGTNLLDFEEYLNSAGIYTYLIPFGKQGDDGKRVDITSVNEGRNYISSETGEKLFGKIWSAGVWDLIDDPETLLKLATIDLSEAIEMSATINIKAVDLRSMGVDVSRIKLGYLIPVISPPHDIDSNFLCSKISLDLDDEGNNEYTLGMTLSGLTDREVSNSRNTNSVIQSTNSVKNSLDSYMIATDEQLVSIDERLKVLEGENENG